MRVINVGDDVWRRTTSVSLLMQHWGMFTLQLLTWGALSAVRFVKVV